MTLVLPTNATVGVAVTVLLQSGLPSDLSSVQGTIHIDSTNVGAALGALCAAGGADVCCFTLDGTTVIPLQWDNADLTGGVLTGDALVTLPNVKQSSDSTDIQLCVIPWPYTPSWTPTDVWDSDTLSAANLQEDPSGSAPQLLDCVTGTNLYAATGMSSGDSIAATIGKGLHTNGSSTYFAGPNLTAHNGDSEATFEAILKLDPGVAGVSATGLASIGPNISTDTHYPYNSDRLYIALFSGSVRPIENYDDSGFDKSVPHHFAVRTKPGSGNYQLVRNGSVVVAGAGLSSVQYDGLVFGKTQNGFYWPGTWDCVRISQVWRSDDELFWRATNQLTNASCFSFGTPVYPTTIINGAFSFSQDSSAEFSAYLLQHHYAPKSLVAADGQIEYTYSVLPDPFATKYRDVTSVHGASPIDADGNTATEFFANLQIDDVLHIEGPDGFGEYTVDGKRDPSLSGNGYWQIDTTYRVGVGTFITGSAYIQTLSNGQQYAGGVFAWSQDSRAEFAAITARSFTWTQDTRAEFTAQVGTTGAFTWMQDSRAEFAVATPVSGAFDWTQATQATFASLRAEYAAMSWTQATQATFAGEKKRKATINWAQPTRATFTGARERVAAMQWTQATRAVFTSRAAREASLIWAQPTRATFQFRACFFAAYNWAQNSRCSFDVGTRVDTGWTAGARIAGWEAEARQQSYAALPRSSGWTIEERTT